MLGDEAGPWRKAFKQMAALPSADLGPVECCELARLAAAWASVDILKIAPKNRYDGPLQASWSDLF